MIDTIFYFVETDAEYQLKRAQGEISNRTIVFVEDAREIYLNGRGYGKTSLAGLIGTEEFNSWKTTLQERLSQIVTDQVAGDQATAAALQEALNQAKQDLQQEIATANGSIQSTNTDLQNFINSIDTDINTAIQQALGDALENNNGVGIWTVIDNTNEQISAITTKIDNITDEDGNIKYTAALQSVIDEGIENNTAFTNIANRWAVLDENQAVIEWLASGFTEQVAENTTFASVYSATNNAVENAISQAKTEVLQTVAGNYVASSNLSTEVTGIIENSLSVESLSDIALKSDVQQSAVNITAAYQAENAEQNAVIQQHTQSITTINAKSTEQDARLDLLTTVTTPAGGNTVYSINEANLDSAVASILANSGSQSASQINIIAESAATGVDIQSAIEGATANLATKAYADNAAANVAAYLKDGNGNIITSASLQNYATADHATLTALASTVNGLSTAQAGMVTQTGLSNAVASLISQNSDVQSAITTYVNGNDSSITLSADQIYLDATHTVANTIQATNGAIGGFDISQGGINATNSSTGYGIELTTNHLQTRKNNVPTNSIESDGSGYIASGGISWDNNGNITISQAFLKSLTTALTNGINISGAGTVRGYDAEVVMNGAIDNNNIPRGVDKYGNYISFMVTGVSTNSITTIYYYDTSNLDPDSVTLYNPFPVNGTLQEKRNWILNTGYIQWKLQFTSGILQNKTAIDGRTGITIDELSESEINSRVIQIRACTTTNEIKEKIDYLSSTTEGYSLTNYRGFYAGEELPSYSANTRRSNDVFNVPNPQEGDFIISRSQQYVFSGIRCYVYTWDSSESKWKFVGNVANNYNSTPYYTT